MNMVRSHDIYWMSFMDIMIKSRGEDWNLINRFNPVTFLAPMPSQDLDLQCHMWWSFLCS
jgi:hypothetical protein